MQEIIVFKTVVYNGCVNLELVFEEWKHCKKVLHTINTKYYRKGGSDIVFVMRVDKPILEPFIYPCNLEELIHIIDKEFPNRFIFSVPLHICLNMSNVVYCDAWMNDNGWKKRDIHLWNRMLYTNILRTDELVKKRRGIA